MTPNHLHTHTTIHVQGARGMQDAHRPRRHGLDGSQSLPALRAARTCMHPCGDPLLSEPMAESAQPERAETRTKKRHASNNECVGELPPKTASAKPPPISGSRTSKLHDMLSCSLFLGTPPRRMPRDGCADASALRASLGLSASGEVNRGKARTGRGGQSKDPLLRSSTSLGLMRVPSDFCSPLSSAKEWADSEGGTG